MEPGEKFKGEISLNGNTVREWVITAPMPITDMLDATTNSSPKGVIELIPGLTDGGEVKLEGNYDLSNAGLSLLISSNSNIRCVIKNPSNQKTCSFSAFLSTFKIIHDGQDFSATLKVTGPINK